MNKNDEYGDSAPNPATLFLKWSSDDKKFAHWGGEKNVLHDLPFDFLVLQHKNCISGFNEEDNTGIYSNEIPAFKSKDIPFKVKTFKGKLLGEGFYADISKTMPDGFKWTDSLWCMNRAGECINIKFVGAAGGEWGAFMKGIKDRRRLSDEFIRVATAEDRKKGKTDYTVPVFSIAGSCSVEEDKKSREVYKSIRLYFDQKNEVEPEPEEQGEEQSTPPLNPPPVATPADDKDMPF